ncbi:DUF1853 domain-containing protein [Parendozoicomonas haliclonae]|uniref:DUF1853 domain-containing protein n=2 Tax=Parendozoicomonas haliclonae TaxID=1960125 RepID=A0A1X7AM40_9GAMM|nr:hypothetical protein EHSB41UT_03156 [Parendozoicomonas haliclonae]
MGYVTQPLALTTGELKWLLQSPMLLDPSAHPCLLSSQLPWLSPDRRKQVCHDLSHPSHEQTTAFLETLTARRSTRLGIRYETLWLSLYQSITEYEVLATNLQVQEKGRTLGEFDLLYRAGDRYIHQELAIKFYLGKPESKGDWYDWVGPDQADQLGRKMALMFEHQINLSKTEPGEQTLSHISPANTDWQQEVLLQGYLFYPWQQPCAEPEQVNPNHLRGDWLPFEQLSDYLATLSAKAFMIPSRQQWLNLTALAEQGETDDVSALSEDELIAHLKQHFSGENKQRKRPQLVMPQIPEGRPFFVTPDDWLDRLNQKLTNPA